MSESKGGMMSEQRECVCGRVTMRVEEVYVCTYIHAMHVRMYVGGYEHTCLCLCGDMSKTNSSRASRKQPESVLPVPQFASSLARY